MQCNAMRCDAMQPIGELISFFFFFFVVVVIDGDIDKLGLALRPCFVLWLSSPVSSPLVRIDVHRHHVRWRRSRWPRDR